MLVERYVPRRIMEGFRIYEEFAGRQTAAGGCFDWTSVAVLNSQNKAGYCDAASR
jgi:hypothetical protein